MVLEDALMFSPSEVHEYPDIFKDDCGLDFVIPEKKLHAIKGWGKGKRKVMVNITSWRGTSSNAIHYYGTLDIDGVEMEYDDEPGHTTCADLSSLCDWKYRLILKRQVTQEEIDNDPKRWECYIAGYLTDRFNTQDEIIKLATEIYHLRFIGEWELWVKYVNRKTVKIL